MNISLEKMEIKIFLFGLDAAGKTTLVRYLKDEIILENPLPTTYFEIESTKIKNVDFIIWDAPGQLKYREQWSRGVLDANILLFLLDTADKGRFGEARTELHNILNHTDAGNVPLIFCYHKMDLDAALNNKDLAESFFDLEAILDRKIYPIETSVYDPPSIEFLKNLLVEMVEIEDWKYLD